MNLVDFLINLAENPDQYQAFRADPSGTMQKAGVSEEDQKVILGGDPQALRDRVNAENMTGQVITIIFISVQ